MSEKTSQNTQDMLIEETFHDPDAFYSSTIDESDQDDGDKVSKTSSGKSKKTLYFAGAGVIAVLAVGYVMFSGGEEQYVPMMQNQVSNQMHLQQSSPDMVAIPQLDSVVIQNETSELSDGGDSVNVPDFTQQLASSESILRANKGVTQERGSLYNQDDININSISIVEDNDTFIEEDDLIKPISNTNSNQGFENNVELNESINKISDLITLTGNIEFKIKDFEDKLTGIARDIESANKEMNIKIEALDEIDKEIQEKLSSLELTVNDMKGEIEKDSKKAITVKQKETKVSNVTPKPVAKQSVKPSVKTESKSETIVDKSSNDIKHEVVVSKNTTNKGTAKPSKEVIVHSVFAGRVWTRNNDGTLATFVVGEKLPNGEVIKKIEENSVITNSGKVYQ